MNVKNLIFGIAIFLLTLSVGIYGINTFYGSSPKWEDYCQQITNEQECISSGGIWVNYTNEMIKPVGGPIENGYCDNYRTCQPKYDEARKDYSRKIFFIALPFGIVTIGIGAIAFGLISVGGGIMAGGVGIIIYGVMRYWEFADDWLKFVLSLLGLVIVIVLSYHVNKKWLKKR